MEKPTFPVAVVMQRRTVQNRWTDCVWEPVRVVAGESGPARQLMDDGSVVQWLHPGFTLVLHKDEAEGYFLNCSGTEPKVFVLWRMDGERGVPVEVTVSSEEAGRWMDGGHSIDGVAITPEIFTWVGEWVEKNYRPQPQVRIKPRSFRHPKDRM
jgi:hypothetical protein